LREREREGGRERGRGREGERERERGREGERKTYIHMSQHTFYKCAIRGDMCYNMALRHKA
jgi:hypothetical protein